MKIECARICEPRRETEREGGLNSNATNKHTDSNSISQHGYAYVCRFISFYVTQQRGVCDNGDFDGKRPMTTDLI